MTLRDFVFMVVSLSCKQVLLLSAQKAFTSDTQREKKVELFALKRLEVHLPSSESSHVTPPLMVRSGINGFVPAASSCAKV